MKTILKVLTWPVMVFVDHARRRASDAAYEQYLAVEFKRDFAARQQNGLAAYHVNSIVYKYR